MECSSILPLGRFPWKWVPSFRMGRQPSCFSPLISASLRDQANNTDAIQASQEKGSDSSTNDMMKLFTDAQQNMLYLNKQRLTAIEELQNAKKDQEVLLARIGQLEAEIQASVAETEVLKRQLEILESKFGAGSWKRQNSGKKDLKGRIDPPSVFSELLLRLDSLVFSGAVDTAQAGMLRTLVLKQDSQAADVFCSHRDIDDRELAGYFLNLLNQKQRNGLHIVHICTELAPIAVSGSLATFVTGLSRALRRKGNIVEVILPKYASIDMSCVEHLREIQAEFYSFFSGHWHKNKIWTGVVYGIAVTFIEPLHPGGFFSREYFYDYSDDFERFSYFCRASLEYLVKSGKRPGILHLHNWHTAAVAPLFWDIFVNQGFEGTRILFTCHSFELQCLQEPHKLALCGLDPQRLHRPDRLQDNLDPRLVNILKGGIVYSNKVTTVSPAYAEDVMTREHGHGLESTLLIHKNKFAGIYNGLDESFWNPTLDPFLPSIYTPEDLSGKAQCKAVLQQRLKLASSNTLPLIGCIIPHPSDLEVKLIQATLNCSIMREVQFVCMCAREIPHIRMMAEDLQESKNTRFLFKYDESMAHLIIAASDIFACLSLNEPTGQMLLIAMQYGSIPITKQGDKLLGSFIDALDILHQSEATGFTFKVGQESDLIVTLNRAIDLLNTDPGRWSILMRNGMTKDVSWDVMSAEEYVASYTSILQL